MQVELRRAGRGLMPELPSCHWFRPTSLSNASMLIGPQALWTPPISLCSVFADVCYIPAVDSDTQWDLPQISSKNIQFASKARHPKALGLTGAPNSLIRPQKHPEPTITQSSSPSQLRGARRGASGADGACTGEGEAAGPTSGVHPAGCQRWAGGGRLIRVHRTKQTHKPGLTQSGRTHGQEAVVWEYFAFRLQRDTMELWRRLAG